MVLVISAAPPILGEDEAWDKATPAELVAGAYRWVAGYLSPDKTGKNLTASLVHSYLDAGVAVLALYEYAADAARKGYQQGLTDGRFAGGAMASMGWPQGRSCYFAVDFQATPAELPTIVQYLVGCHEAIGKYGYYADAYGDYDVILELKRRGLISHGFQTYAWSDNRWVSDVAIRQTENGILLAGHNVDRDLSYVHDFGQWIPPNWIGGGIDGGVMQPDQAKQLADVDWTVTQVPSFNDPTKRVPLHVWCSEINTAVNGLEKDHLDIRKTTSGTFDAVTALGQAITALTDANGKALQALAQTSGAEVTALDLWARIAAALERLAPPSASTPPPAASPAPAPVADTLP